MFDISPMKWLEIIAVILAILCVWQTVKENIWCWITGSVSNLLFCYAFFTARLYSDMALQLVYVLLNAYGWYQWLHGGKRQSSLSVTMTTIRTWIVLALVALILTSALGQWLSLHTNTDVPYWDATTTVMSLVAQFMLAKKLIENWWIWISVNVMYIGIYYYKMLYLTSGLQIIFIALSIMGYLEWKKSLRAAEEA